MKLSTHQVAKKLGLTPVSLGRYIKAGKITAPPETMVGGIKLRLWSESDIERLREALPKIKNGRKTRYQKLREKQKAPAKSPVPRKTKKKK
jgi:predicted DNA-binding transcriptional regulator AlpA